MDLEGHLIGGQYDVKRRLQSGYFGVTWLALNRATNTDVCIKVKACTELDCNTDTSHTLSSSYYANVCHALCRHNKVRILLLIL